jgi:hypothetical protein
MDHGEAGMGCEPLFHLVTGVMRYLIKPQ